MHVYYFDILNLGINQTNEYLEISVIVRSLFSLLSYLHHSKLVTLVAPTVPLGKVLEPRRCEAPQRPL